jgi:hypothetical protein
MNSRRDEQVRIHKPGPEADEALLEESILHWRRLGPEAVWDAIYEMLDLWFLARGMDPEAQRVDRAHAEVHPVARRRETTEARLRG